METDTLMRISFIIPAYNEEHRIGGCIASALKETLTHPEIEAEIIVADNGSTDKTKSVSEQYPGVRVVEELQQKGPTHARERGFREAKGDLLAYLDADVRLPEGWLAKALEEFRKKPEMVCLSGPYRYYDLRGIRKAFAESTWTVFAPLTYRIFGYMVLGGNFVVRRSALAAIDGFDRSVEFYGDDTNLAWRLSKKGKVVWRMDFYVLTSGRRLLQEGLIRSYIVYGINYLWMAIFHRPFHLTHRDIR